MIDSWFTDPMAGWVTLVIVGALAIAGFILAIKLPDMIVLIGSCWIGCYGLAAGIGILLEQYPRKVYGTGWWAFWIYFLSQMIGFILCVLWQSNEYASRQYEKEMREERLKDSELSEGSKGG
jgi:predicted membrane channel-forming protein YqfA (hemolysin III family)